MSTSTRTLDRIAHLAALATGATIAQINLVTEAQQIPVAVHFDPARASSDDCAADSVWRRPANRDASYYAPEPGGEDSVAIDDTRVHSFRREQQDAVGDRVRSYAATRLKTPAGVVLGTVCVANYEPRVWSTAERAALEECAALAGEELAAQLAYVTAERSRLDAARAQTDAEVASRAKSELLAVLSRELRTQLDTMRDYAELLETEMNGSPPAPHRDDLRRLQLGQRHLLALVDDVLNYSNLEHGATSFALTTVGVREALAEAEAVVAPQVRAKAIFLALGDGRGDLSVVADIEKLREILTNLLANAVEFTGAGGRIDVACDATRANVRIRIHDTGVGIPADKLDVIFEPFVQLRADPERTLANAGLGLAISRALARGQGGDLTAESTVGSGSTFTLTLPRAKRAD